MSNNEARRRVYALYKAWYRQIPYRCEEYDIPVTEKKAKETLKKSFLANAGVTDTRVIDMLVIKVNPNHGFKNF